MRLLTGLFGEFACDCLRERGAKQTSHFCASRVFRSVHLWHAHLIVSILDENRESG